GIGGETNVESTLVNEFKIGQAARKSWRMLVGGEHELGPDMDALLGEDFFQHFDVEFDLAHAMVKLYQSKDCEGVWLAYWARKGAREVEIDPIDEVHPKIRLTVRINDEPLRALLDSGAGVSLLDVPIAARLGVTAASPGVIRVGRAMG